jgi:putative ATPase
MSDVREKEHSPVPLALRNATTGFMAGLGYGRDYKYSHEYEGHFTEQDFLPPSLQGTTYYRPSDNGEERTIRARLNEWWKSRKR